MKRIKCNSCLVTRRQITNVTVDTSADPERSKAFDEKIIWITLVTSSIYNLIVKINIIFYWLTTVCTHKLHQFGECQSVFSFFVDSFLKK